ncbi:ABC transporter permease [Streptomyces sp. GbtcB6]|uniref:ABC transporter permease n=1 Tax=Streptomyces sp. GbtcB6 TaxID=2824751 RepID=UPI001C2F9EDB|nr:ABC transporter permease [Streptomyces sp. GbtcB6]
MTTTLATKPEPAVPADHDRDRDTASASVFALAVFEARQLLLQIPLLVFGLLYLAYVGYGLFGRDEGMDAYPVLHDVDRTTQGGPELFAVALLVCVHRAALLDRRRGLEEQFGVLAMAPARRTLAHALSVVPFAVGMALVVDLQFAWSALRPGAVGHGSLFELAVAPLTVLLAGALGVLLARVLPHPAAPLLILLALGFVTILLPGGSGTHGVHWLWPVVLENGGTPVPGELLGRPAGWHALYLVGLTVLLVCAAMWVAGGRARVLKAATAVALAAAVAGAAGQAPGDSAGLQAARKAEADHPARYQTCVERAGSRYCAYPDWKGWTVDWAGVVHRVQAEAGGDAAMTRLTVRQRIQEIIDLTADATLPTSSTPGTVTVGTQWGGNRVPEFAVGVARVLVAGSEHASLDMCDARVVTTMWLALATDPTPTDTFRHLRIDDSLSGPAAVLTSDGGSMSVSAQQTEVVRELFREPHDTVAARVKAHWQELVSPHTTTAEAARLLGVKVPKGPDDCQAG